MWSSEVDRKRDWVVACAIRWRQGIFGKRDLIEAVDELLDEQCKARGKRSQEADMRRIVREEMAAADARGNK